MSFNNCRGLSKPGSGQRGFTLIELMVTIAIVSILAMIALPQYSEYLRRGRIADATAGLANKRTKLEQFFDNSRSYSGAPDCANDSASSNFFDFSCAATATTYTITATGKGGMVGFTFTIDEANNKATTSVPSGWTTNATCWVLRADGSC